MKVVLDTNVVLYQINGRLAESLPRGEYLVSVITRIELLSFPNLTSAHSRKVRAFLERVQVVGLDEAVERSAIRLRKQARLKMADALIVATAKVARAKLCTCDKDLAKVASPRVLMPELKGEP